MPRVNRTIVFQCSSNVNSDSIFLVTEKYLVFTFLLCKKITKFGTQSVRVNHGKCMRSRDPVSNPVT